MSPSKRVTRMADHEVSVRAAELEAATSVGDRSSRLRGVLDERGASDAVRVLLAYADRYPRGAVLLAPHFFAEVAASKMTKPEAAADAVLQEVRELISVVEKVLRGG